jgi:protein-S-isoprenylcysteine O-methyltransferase Ste14
LKFNKNEKEMKNGFMYYFAGILLIIAYLIPWFLDNPVHIKELWYAGWLIWIIGLVLLFLPMFIFRNKGLVMKKNDWTKTTVLVDTGIYSIIRHPLYLGWSLMYFAIILWSQHFLTITIGITGVICVYLISRKEDQLLIKKFGNDYLDYMKKVPRMNFFSGIIQFIRRRKKKKS